MSPNTTPSAPTTTATRTVCLAPRVRAGEVDSEVVSTVGSPVVAHFADPDCWLGSQLCRCAVRAGCFLVHRRVPHTVLTHMDCGGPSHESGDRAGGFDIVAFATGFACRTAHHDIGGPFHDIKAPRGSGRGCGRRGSSDAGTRCCRGTEPARGNMQHRGAVLDRVSDAGRCRDQRCPSANDFLFVRRRSGVVVNSARCARQLRLLQRSAARR
jgi:hypothetical protein